jgi:F-type H+-transporting ATPase subunit a
MLLGLIVAVELISYSIKLVSLSGRLFANIFSGHVLLAILSGATFALLSDVSTFTIGIVGPVVIVFTVFCLEFFIAFLQAYVFANLGAMYLGDTIAKTEH